MEEILASIRRIISEDDAPEEAGAEAAAPEPEAEPDFGPVADDEPEAVVEAEPEIEASEDVLELTEPYTPPSSVSIGDIDAFEAPEPVAAAPAPAPKPAPAPAPKPAIKAEPVVGGLVSETTESSAASAFGSLAGALLVPHSERTLEDVTKDLLRPLLQSWLDAHLPAIVEEQVRIEVERIARQSRR